MEYVFQIVFGAFVSALVGLIGMYLAQKIHEHNWRKENIYRPMYNEIYETLARRGYNINVHFQSTWEKLDSYTRLRVSDTLRIKFNGWVNHLGGLRKVLLEFGSFKNKYDELCIKSVKKWVPEEFISADGKLFVIEKTPTSSSTVPIPTLLEMFEEPLSSGKRGDALYAAVLRHSKDKNLLDERILQSWKARCHDLWDRIASAISDPELAKGDNNILDIIKRREEKRKEITTMANEISSVLAEKVNRTFRWW